MAWEAEKCSLARKKLHDRWGRVQHSHSSCTWAEVQVVHVSFNLLATCVYRFKAVVDTDHFVVKTFDRRVSVSSYRTPVPSDTYLEMLQEVSTYRDAGTETCQPLYSYVYVYVHSYVCMYVLTVVTQ